MSIARANAVRCHARCDCGINRSGLISLLHLSRHKGLEAEACDRGEVRGVTGQQRELMFEGGRTDQRIAF